MDGNILPFVTSSCWSTRDACCQFLYVPKDCRNRSRGCHFRLRFISSQEMACCIFAQLLRIPQLNARIGEPYLVFYPVVHYAKLLNQLEPYFCRIRFDKEQKRRWFLDREGVLFGFAFAFTVVLKAPFIGVLMYGIAQASTAYLITKITDPPPPPAYSAGFAESQVRWKNKHEFLRLPLDKLDKFNVDRIEHQGNGDSTSAPITEKKSI